MQLSRAIIASVILANFSTDGLAQSSSAVVWLYDDGNNEKRLDDVAASFAMHQVNAYLDECTAEDVLIADKPSMYYRKLSIGNGLVDNTELLMQTRGLNEDEVVVYKIDGTDAGPGKVRHYRACSDRHLLPVLALMADMDFETNATTPTATTTTTTIATTEAAAAENPISRAVAKFLSPIGGLSSHEPNLLMMRSDDNDDHVYMDFTISVKHPFLGPLHLPGTAYSFQTYLAFSGRFSQYVGTRDSSPVVARRFNPAIYMRVREFWDSHLDLGFAHESNGQQIDDKDTFEKAKSNYEPNPVFARDEISRGWDYLAVDWEKKWRSDFFVEGISAARLNLKHFLPHGPLQDAAEDYNDWEGGANRYRRQYDGASLEMRFDFSDDACVWDERLCLRKVGWNHTTGIANLGQYNTDSLELTTSVGNIPFIVWGRTGYNSDLVDYFDYATSWGIGLELVSF